jgi:ubiquinone/menaquinone biosynthesis C-methylase UbiE
MSFSHIPITGTHRTKNMTDTKKERYWSRFARSYDEYADYVVGKSLRQALKERFCQEHDLGDVIEFGCGTGFFTKAIVPKAHHVFATDLSDEMLKVASDELKDFSTVTILKADCEGSPFPSEIFDTAFMANVLMTVENPSKALRECHRLLKKRGVLIVNCYTDYGLHWFEKMAVGMRYFEKFGFPPSRGLKNYSPGELKYLVEKEGFITENLELLGDRPKALYLKARKD